MTFSRWVFRLAGIYGLILLVPHYFMESHLAHDDPAGLTHPEFFYGFLGVAIAWQVAFLIIAHNPVRFRPMIIPAIIEKFSFAAAVGVLFLQQRVPAGDDAGCRADRFHLGSAVPRGVAAARRSDCKN
jgi:hypothetical protein